MDARIEGPLQGSKYHDYSINVSESSKLVAAIVTGKSCESLCIFTR